LGHRLNHYHKSQDHLSYQQSPKKPNKHIPLYPSHAQKTMAILAIFIKAQDNHLATFIEAQDNHLAR